MTLRLEAFSRSNGFGIFRVGGELKLVRPPYSLANSALLSESALSEAVSRFGFLSADREFGSWNDAIAFLKNEIVQAHREVGREIPAALSSTEIIRVAPPEVLSSFLDRVEYELIRDGSYGSAEDFLLTFLMSGVAQHHSELAARAVSLLKKNKQARAESEFAIEQLTIPDVQFPTLNKHGLIAKSLALANAIQRRGCVVAPCS